jgi:RNA polymerase sigma factor (sigma-70 family)
MGSNASTLDIGIRRAEPLRRGFRLSGMLTHDRTDHAQLLEDFLGGRDDAFDPLYAEYNHRIFAYVSRMIFDEDAAKDIAHQVWEKVILQRANPDRERVENVRGYLFTLAKNLSLDHLRRIKKYAGVEAASELAAQEHSMDDKALIVQALRQLPEETREILVLNYYCGYSFEEIAEMLGKKPNAIWTRASRARTTLREIMERLMNYERSGR